MVSVSEVFKAWQDGFANKDSSKLAEYFTEDFRFVSRQRDMSKQETLGWTAGGGQVIDNLRVIYENDEVAVIHQSANRADGDGIAMGVYTKKDGKISRCEYVRTAL